MEFLPSMRDPKENPNKLVQNTNRRNTLLLIRIAWSTQTPYIYIYVRKFRNRKEGTRYKRNLVSNGRLRREPVGTKTELPPISPWIALTTQHAYYCKLKIETEKEKHMIRKYHVWTELQQETLHSLSSIKRKIEQHLLLLLFFCRHLTNGC